MKTKNEHYTNRIRTKITKIQIKIQKQIYLNILDIVQFKL